MRKGFRDNTPNTFSAGQKGYRMNIYCADLLVLDNQVLHEHALLVEGDKILGIQPQQDLTPEQRQAAIRFENAMIVPGFVNSHNHSFQSLIKGFRDDADFFTWRDEALYRYAQVLSREDIYTGALFAFGEMLKCGITTVCDFFYINDQANENAQAVIEAALDIGIRIVMNQAVANTEALHRQFKDDPMVHVLPAPHSLHGASINMILAGAELAERLDTKYHMHIAEGQYERQMVQEKHGKPPIAFLNELGVLNNRLVGIHCVWVDDAEIDLMASQGTGLSYNPSSNMFLGDGVTRIKEMLEAGICISLGTDGGCSNNRASIIEEMRMTSLLQKVKFCDATVTRAEDMFRMGTENGGKNLGLPIGSLQAGYFADFTVINLDDLSMQPKQNALNNLVYSSQPSAIHAVYVAGEKVFETGKLLTIPEQEIVRRIQLTTESWS
jgi:5-methylthioadenosine/S-adenosylhomocysteine deaminase